MQLSLQSVVQQLFIKNNTLSTNKFLFMKILVCISKTPDTTAKIAFADNNTKFAADGIQWIINPYDEWYALVRAIELKEAKKQGTDRCTI